MFTKDRFRYIIYPKEEKTVVSYVRLRNFKSFSNVMFDLRGPHGIPKKLAFVYGENGAGKSNLMLAMLFIMLSFDTVKIQASQRKLNIPSADEMKEGNIPDELIGFFEALKSRYYTLPELIDRYWTIDNTEPMEVEIGFYCNGKSGHYLTKFSREEIIEEKLYYTINERAGAMFSIERDKAVLSPSVFIDTKYRQELAETIEKFWGKHTFFSILFEELRSKNKEYIENRILRNLLVVLEMFQKISTWYKGGTQETARVAVPVRFLKDLERGKIESEQDTTLHAFEKILNQFFTQLYSDIKRVYYRLEKKDNKVFYELYFDKICGKKLRAVPISQESTGTKKLLETFPLLFSCTMNTTAFVDEIDTGIHDLLMKETIELLQESLKETEEGQFIATTHNTLLLDSLEPESIYILRSKIDGEKELVCVTDYAFRTHRNNSIRHKYLQGIYQGVPQIGYLDLNELVADAMREIRENGEEA